MTAYNVADHPRNRRIVFIHAGAISAAFVSGTFALVALLVGTPFEFGIALALCGAAWIVAHIAEQFAERERARSRSLETIRPTAPAHSAPSHLRLGAPIRVDRHSPTRERILSTV